MIKNLIVIARIKNNTPIFSEWKTFDQMHRIIYPSKQLFSNSIFISDLSNKYYVELGLIAYHTA